MGSKGWFTQEKRIARDNFNSINFAIVVLDCFYFFGGWFCSGDSDDDLCFHFELKVLLVLHLPIAEKHIYDDCSGKRNLEAQIWTKSSAYK